MFKAFVYMLLGLVLGFAIAAFIFLPRSIEAEDNLETSLYYLCDGMAPYGLLSHSYLSYKQICEPHGFRVITLEDVYQR